MDYNEKREQALRNADVSLRMEGLSPSAELEGALRRVLDGQMTEEAYLTEVLQRTSRKGS